MASTSMCAFRWLSAKHKRNAWLRPRFVVYVSTPVNPAWQSEVTHFGDLQDQDSGIPASDPQPPRAAPAGALIAPHLQPQAFLTRKTSR